MTVVRLSGKLVCTSAAEAEIIKRYLPEHIRLTRDEPGCVSFDVLATKDPLVWHVDECFVDHAAFSSHQERTRSSRWWTETAAIRRESNVTGLT